MAGRPGGAAARRPFLYYFDTPVSGAAVDADSDALAAALAARGLGRGDRVALFMQNVPQFVIALLAAWKLGAIAVPVNPMLKERELRHVLADSGARAMVSLQDLWNETGARAVAGTAVTVAITTSPLDYLAGGPRLPRCSRTWPGRRPPARPTLASCCASTPASGRPRSRSARTTWRCLPTPRAPPATPRAR